MNYSFNLISVIHHLVKELFYLMHYLLGGTIRDMFRYMTYDKGNFRERTIAGGDNGIRGVLDKKNVFSSIVEWRNV